MSGPAGRAGLPAAAGTSGAASPARAEIGQPRVWLAAAASDAAIGTVFQILPPYTAAVGRALGVSATAAGLGMTVFLLPAPLLAVPVGAFCDRHGSRLLTRAGFGILLASAILLAAVPGFGWLLAVRAVGGVGAGLVMVRALKMLAARVPAPQLGAALGVFVAGLPAGTVVAVDIIAPVAGGQAWRTASLGAAAAVAAAFTAAAWAGADAPAARPAGPGPSVPAPAQAAAPARGGPRVLASALRDVGRAGPARPRRGRAPIG
jgi:MFS family permease